MKKIFTILMVMALIITTAGCAGIPKTDNQPSTQTASPKASDQQQTEPVQTPEAQNIKVVDSRGAEVVFEKQPERVISIMPSNTEILYALGAGEKVIAVSEYCNYPEDTANKEKLPAGEKMNIESIIAMEPDAAFIGKMSVMDDQIKQLEEAGVKVVVTEANSLEETYNVIKLIGQCMGKDKEAEAIVDSMVKGFEEIRESVKGKTFSTVYVEVSPLQYGLWSCGKNTFVQELIDIIGAKNIFDDVEGWASVSEEQVFERNPDVILTTASPLTGIDDPVGEITGRKNWGSIKAVSNNMVLMLNSDMISRPGPRLLDAARELKNAVYQK